MLLLIVLAILSQKTKATVTFLTGEETRYDYGYNNQGDLFNCKNKASYSKTVNFADSFARVPQIIISNYMYNLDISLTPTEVSLDITSITTTSFSTAIYCPSVGRFYGFWFTWIAIDDDRIFVINQLNYSMVGKSSAILSYSHNNRNYNQAFASINGFGFSGAFDFSFKVINITTDKVYVNFTKSTTNLVQLGFQIVLGTAKAIATNPAFSIPAYTSNGSVNSYDTKFIPIPINSVLIIPYAGLYYKFDINIRQKRTIILSNTSGIQYNYSSWDKSYIDILAQKVWIKSIIDLITPFLCQKMRVLKVLNPSADLLPPMTFTISELGVTQSNTVSKSFDLDPTVTTLNLFVAFQCYVGLKIQGTIQKCISCDIPSWIINQDCYRGHNYVAYKIKLYQKDSLYQTINVQVSQSGFTITQSIINQVPATYTVCSLQIIPKV